MKRRQITAIIAALALAVTSTALLTGCVGKSYYYKVNDDGSLERVGEIKKSTEEAASTTSTETSSTEPTEESKSEEPADESSEEPADESSEEASSDSGETDDNTLAVLTVEMPTDWDAQDVVFKYFLHLCSERCDLFATCGTAFHAFISEWDIYG